MSRRRRPCNGGVDCESETLGAAMRKKRAAQGKDDECCEELEMARASKRDTGRELVCTLMSAQEEIGTVVGGD